VPTYDYECQSCGHGFEKFQSMTARVMRKCPECGERTLERLIGPGGGFLFKGDGFYTTDYRSKSFKDGEKAADKAAKPKSDDSKSSDSKAKVKKDPPSSE
jgi:putative FmdB family regulatory protein